MQQSLLSPLYNNVQRFNKPAAAATEPRFFTMLSHALIEISYFLKRSMEKWRITTYRPATLFFFPSILALPLLCCVGRMGGLGEDRLFFTSQTGNCGASGANQPFFPSSLCPPHCFVLGTTSNTNPGIREQESGLGYMNQTEKSGLLQKSGKLRRGKKRKNTYRDTRQGENISAPFSPCFSPLRATSALL